MNCKEIMQNLNEQEMSDLFRRINDIDIEDFVNIYDEIMTKGSYDNCDHDCIGEFAVSDIEWGCGERDGGYIIYLDDMLEQAYELLSEASKNIIDLARENDIKELYIDIEYVD